MPEYRHSRSGSLNIPHGSPANGPAMTPASRFDGPRSPPNTAHVPCKFFRQGACQAGNACPFSHDLDLSTETICKYFAKGNCKFGPKCANIHILPDGRRISYGKNGVTIGAAPLNLGGRHAPTSPGSNNPTSTSALTTSLYRSDGSRFGGAFAYDERHNYTTSNGSHHLGRQPSLDNGLPLDSAYISSAYGSPREEDPNRFGLALSPVNSKGLSVLDAPLPASFDSNGISNAARFPAAPWPSSVPSKFGLESPTPSLSNAKDSRTSETLKLLHTSAFGSSEHLATPTASSPPNSQTANGEEYFGKRTMHSSRYARPKMLSSSLPKTTSVDRDWEAEFAFGDENDNVPENYLPENLQDLLTPAEKARRGSMRADSEHGADGVTKFGSPFGSSPSRWGPLFSRQKDEEENTKYSRSAASAFGHVGSPLRNSVLAQEMGRDPGATNGSSRPSATRSGSESMSMLSQQFQLSGLEDSQMGSSPRSHLASARLSGGSVKDRNMERHISSGSISSTVAGRFTTPIDEEDPAFVFSMEEEEDPTVVRARKRASAGMGVGNGAGSGGFTYAGAVAGGKASTGSKDPVSGR